VIVFFIIIAGCASFDKKSISPQLSSASFESRSLEEPEVKQFIEKKLGHELSSWPIEKWSLNELTSAAFYFRADMKAAQANWDLAKAGIITASEYPNPALGLIPQYDVDTSGGISPWIVNLPLDFLIETAGKRKYAIEHAKNLTNAAQLNINITAWQIRSSLRESLVNVYDVFHKEKLLSEQLLLQEKKTALLEKQLKQGQISQVEYEKGRIPEDQVRLSLTKVSKQIDENRAELAKALGVPGKAIEKIELSFECIETLPTEQPPEKVRTAALLTRPDLLALLSEYESAQSALQIEIADQYPNIVIGPGYEFDQGQNKWGLQFNIMLPILNQNRGQIA
jgi:cobalt-zinc-cadmium efflux system outer membrane protein